MCNYEFSCQNQTVNLLSTLQFMICKNKISKKWAEDLKRHHKFTYQVVYTLHTTQIPSLKYPTSDRESWLHIGGVSPYKNTDIVISTWLKHPEWPKLYVVCTGLCAANLRKYITNWCRDNIINLGYVENISELQQTIMNHICPSMIEGYGHYINEARAYSRFIVTTDYQPMNELITRDSGILTPCDIMPKKSSPGVYSCGVSVSNLELAMTKALSVKYTARKKYGQHARRDFLNDTREFNRAMTKFTTKINLNNKL